MSGVRMHFCTLVARGYGGVACPRKYGLKGTMPALTNNRLGSSSNSDAEGTAVCGSATLSAKWLVNRRRISAVLSQVSGRSSVTWLGLTVVGHGQLGGVRGRQLGHAVALAEFDATRLVRIAYVMGEGRGSVGDRLPAVPGTVSGEDLGRSPDLDRAVQGGAGAGHEPEHGLHSPAPDSGSTGARCFARYSRRACFTSVLRSLRTRMSSRLISYESLARFSSDKASRTPWARLAASIITVRATCSS